MSNLPRSPPAITLARMGIAPGKTELNRLVALNIRAEMGRRQVSQRELAKAIGLGQSNLNRLLQGQQILRMDHVQAIADALMVSTDALVCRPRPARRAS